MNGTDKKAKGWLPIALCCLPGVTAAIVVIGLSAAGGALDVRFDGPLGLGLLALTLLACPLSMGLVMIRRELNRNMAPGGLVPRTNCCLPAEAFSGKRLAALRARREVLERELAEMQTSQKGSYLL